MASFVVVACFKNETTNLKEWLDHYIWQGADFFYLMDNGSTDQPETVLQDYIDKGLVMLFKDPTKYIQITYYKSIVEQIQKENVKSDWIVIADLDEFWFSTKGNLKKALAEIPENYSVISCGWKEFGPSADGFHPRSLRKELVYRNPSLTSPKYCFRTMKINTIDLECHHIDNVPSECILRNPNNISLHHYFCQSEEYWYSVKIPRGYALGDLSVYGTEQLEVFTKRAKVCTLLDTTLADLLT